MNVVYRVVWNSTTGTWVVASEVAKGRKKKSVSSRVMGPAAGAVGLTLMAGSGVAMASDLSDLSKYIVVSGPSSQSNDAAIAARNSVAIGASANASGTQAIAMGVGAGATNQYAVAIGDKASSSGSSAIAMGSQSAASSEYAIAIGDSSKATAVSTTAVGVFSNAAGRYASAFGRSASAAGDHSVALGQASSNGANSVAVGRIATADGVDSIALGSAARAAFANTTVLGANSSATAEGASAVGEGAVATGVGAVSVGRMTSAAGQGAIALGYNSSANAFGAVALGSDSETAEANTVTVGNAALKRRIINMAEGIADTDAVNMSQLKGSAQSVATALGGGSTVDANGKVSTPKYTVNGAQVTGVGGAVSALDARITSSTDALKWDAGSSTYNAKHGTAATSRISNVSAGVAETDAVNKKQLGEAIAAIPTNPRAVSYTTDAKTEVALGNAKISGLAAGTGDTDAVNVKQLKDAGIIDGTGTTQKAVLFNGPAGEANAQNQKLVNLAAGTADSDAVNVKQLKEAGLIDSTGKSLDAVVYDDASKQAVTLNKGGAAVNLKNVADANERNDAVNLGQLQDAGVFDAQGNALAVAYDDDAKEKITFNKGGAATTLANVADGVADSDAVNVKQLKEAGLIDGTGNTQKAVLFNGPAGEANAQGQKLVNLAEGTTGTDAVNKNQLDNAIAAVAGGTAPNPLAVSYTDNSKTEVALGDGNGGTTKISGLTAGTGDTDAVNVKQLKEAGLIDGSGNAIEAVTYVPGSNKSEIVLAGAGGTQIHNVKDGSAAGDAVNKGQLDGAVQGIKDATADIAPKLRYLKFGNSSAVDATAKGNNAIALGGNSYAQGDNAVAIGLNANAITNSVALGIGSQASEANTVSVGSRTNTRRIVNVAKGTDENDAATVGQVDEKISEALGLSTQSIQQSGARSFSAMSTMSTLAASGSLTPDQMIVSGPTDKDPSVATGQDSVAMGVNNKVTADYSVAAGQNVSVSSEEAVGVGQNVVVNGKQSVAIGSQASVYADNSVVIGSGGSYIDQAATGAVAIGNKIAVGGKDSVAIGNGILSTGTNNVVLGANSTDSSRSDVVSVGKAKAERQIINVKAGTVDTDAVNLSQLKDGAKSVADALGGGSTVDANGKITKPKYKINNTDVTGVDGALAALDDRANSIANDALSWDATSGTYSAKHGTTAENRISNVAAGTAGTDAVNKNQLDDVIALVDASVNELAVSYTDDTKTEVALGDGKGGTAKISGLTAGTDDTDAVNVKQLKEAGIIDGNGDTQKAVLFDGPAGEANAQNQKLINLAAGTDDTDAVNVKQLKEAGLIDSTGNSLNAVVYDDASKQAVTLNKGGAAVNLKNVADANERNDAVNLGQLQDAGVFDAQGNALVVAYDDDSKEKITFNKGGDATTLTNVAAGVADADAVNVKQLKDAGLIDSNGDTQKAVLFDGPTGEANAQNQKLINLTAGTDDTDAVNVKQLKDAGLIDSNGDTQKAVLFDGPAGEANAQNQKLINLTAGTDDTDAVNVKQLKDAGIIDGNGDSVRAVLFNGPAGEANAQGQKLVNLADGTDTNDAVNKGQLETAIATVSGKLNPLAVSYTDDKKTAVALGDGKGGTAKISGLTAGTDDTDAVNVKQLKDAGIIDGNGDTQKAVLFDGPAGEANAQNQKLINLAAGTDDTDAVNVKQLKEAGLIDSTGNSLNAVVYDDASKQAVTLNKGGAAVNLKNVADASERNDAVNLGQLQDAGVFDAQGNALAVAYDDNSKEKITFNKGGDATTLTNVAAGVADADAVNVKQLKDAGLIDSNGDTQKAVLFDGPAGEANAQNQKLINLTAGTDDTDAVNVKQLKDAGIIDGNGNPIEAVTYTPGSAKGEIELAGVGGTQIKNVKDGNDALDAVNKGQLDGAVKEIKEASAEIAPKLKYIKFGVTNAADATAKGTNAVAIGGNAYAQAQGALAIGANANASALNSVAIGIGSQAREENTFAVGSPTSTRRIVNVAAGTEDTDAATVGQVNEIKEALGLSTQSIQQNGARSFSAKSAMSTLAASRNLTPDEMIVSGLTDKNPSVAIGEDSVAMGVNNEVTADFSVAAGQNVSVSKAEAVGVGQNVVVNGKQSVAIGAQASVYADSAVVIGSGGSYIDQAATGAVAIGNKVAVAKENSVAIGNNAMSTGVNSVVLGANSKDDGRSGVVSVGVGKAERQIINVKAGEKDTDAVNVGQLKASGIIDANGNSVRAVLFDGPLGEANAQGQKLVNLAEGTTGTDAVNKNQLDNAIAAVAGGTAPNPLAVSYTDNSKTEVALGDGNGGTAKISGVTAGTDDSDAVNVKQLKDAGIIDGNGDTQKAVLFDGPAGEANAQNQKLINLTAGTDDTDAVNVKQLKDAGIIDANGNSVRAVLFNGPAGEANAQGQKLVNLAAGTANTDAVNKGQLDNAIAAVAGGTAPNPLGVSYTDNSKTEVALGDGNGGTAKISGVTAGTGDTDAVNVGQLKDAGLIDSNGTSLSAVVYDDASKAKATLGGAAGTVLDNVGAGQVSAASMQAINGSQLFGTAQSVADALGGGSVVGADGKVSKPKYTVGGSTVDGVEGAVSALDGRIDNIAAGGDALQWDSASQAYTAKHGGQTGNRITDVADGVNATDAVNKGQLDQALANTGGANLLGVNYDDANMDSVTLGGTAAQAAGKAVKLKNVAAATADDEAVNLRQLKDAGLVDQNTGDAMDAVVYDANSSKATVTFGGAQGTLLTNVADGRIASGSRDAVNGGQIAALRDSLQNSVTNIDARVTHIENNVVTGTGSGTPPYVAANAQADTAGSTPANAGDSAGVAVGYDSVASGDGASAVGDHATAAGKDSVAIGNNASTTSAAKNSVALGNDSVADTENTVSVGSAGKERTLSNVASGTRDTDAATMGQMRETLTQANAYTDSRLDDVWNDLSQEISHVNRQANRGIAAASALINVTPYVPGHVTVNAGVASYRGEAALGVGVSRWSDNGRVNVNAGVSAAQGDKPVMRVGIGLIF